MYKQNKFKRNKDVVMLEQILAKIFDNGTTHFYTTCHTTDPNIEYCYNIKYRDWVFYLKENTRINEIYTYFYRMIQYRKYSDNRITVLVKNNRRNFTRYFYVNDRNAEKLLKYIRDVMDLTGKKYIPCRIYPDAEPKIVNDIHLYKGVI